jgi:hypothetical protein
MKYTSAIIFMLIPVLMTSCNNDEPEFTDTPIVESYLCPGKHPSVKISRQIPFSTGVIYSSDDIDSLPVELTFNSETHILKPEGNGEYTDSSIVVTEGVDYSLSFVFNSKNVSAFTTVPLRPVNFSQSSASISVIRMDSTSGPPSGGPFGMPEPIQLTWDNDDISYYIVVIENMENTLDPIRDFGDREPPGNMFRERPTTSSGLELRPQEFQYFGKHRLILYHVLPDYASLYDSKISSSQNLTNPSTSIINGYGIFTGLNADTLYVQVNEASK